MKGRFVIPVTVAMLALPAMAAPADAQRAQQRVTVERNADGAVRRTAERRAATVRTTDDGVVVTRQAERTRVVRRPDSETTPREKYQKFKRKLHARAKNAVENGARPKVVRHKVQKAKKKFIRRLKSGHNN